MASLEEGTWHESHVVWHLPPSACVHVTHDTWRMKSKCEESERKFPLCGIKPRRRLWGKKNNSVEERKGKEGEKEKKEKKRKEKKGEKKKGKEKKKEKEKGSDSRCFEGRKSLVLELKLVYSTRATCRCQKQKR